MNIEIITPRFCETDALGHINNVSYVAWLEQGRTEFFRVNKIGKHSPLILAKLEINYCNEGFHHDKAQVHTAIAKLGNSTFHISQKVYQNEKLLIDASAVLVQFDLTNKHSLPFTSEQRAHWESLIES